MQRFSWWVSMSSYLCRRQFDFIEVKEDNGQSWVPIVWDEAVFGVELKL
jgi:hypothetical protein